MDTGGSLQFDAVPVPTPPGGPLAVELVPAPDPWTVARKLAPLTCLFFLDSAEKHAERGRYSYVAANPYKISTGPGNDPGRFARPAAQPCDGHFGLGRPAWVGSVATAPDLPPFQGGLGGVFGYGLLREQEPQVPASRWDEFRQPLVSYAMYDWVVSFDHAQNRAWVVSTGCGERRSADRAAARLTDVIGRLRAPGFLQPRPIPRLNPVAASDLCPQFPLPDCPGVTSNFDRAGYEAAVRRVVEYIHAGDCFQVNLSQRLLAPLREHPFELYGRLRHLNPAPFGAYFDALAFQVLSASPERFLRAHPDGRIETRPIKGTRPRGKTAEADAAFARDLASSPKDRAENVMIVDLLRNDIGKVAEFGSVTVPRVCEVESFRYVHHLVSEVRGRLRPGVGALDLLAAAFPGGSVTGAPKVRAMEIIAELEPTARGPYCGCLGWVGFNGAMDTNILIRTFTAGRGWVQFPVGGGIVADSDPAREYEETLHKAAGLLRALEPQ
ncbi:MAG TPA: aminodeoxychorismate synthase component I [Gemmata sp.]